MITQQTIDAIFQCMDIVDTIGEFVKLKKRGVNFLGLCPFHNEKTGSFTVSPAKQIYKCFGCGKSGNTVTFLMEHEKFTYPEALRWLAGRYNVEIIEEKSAESVVQHQITDSLYTLNNFATKIFASQIGEAADYIQERKLTEESVKKFLLGYSAGTDFTAYALKQQFAKDILLKSGLSIERNDELKDAYRNRLIIPIPNIYGKIVGFAARIIGKSEREPKYINTPENEVYNKSKMVFGLYHAKHAIAKADECMVTEGHLDVISLHQHEIENVVATGGTAITVDQIQLIKKWTEHITLIYDGDDPGIKAAIRAIDVALQQDIELTLVRLPDKTDPDSYVHQVGREGFLKYVMENKLDFVSFLCKFLYNGNNKSTVAATIAEKIAKLRGPTGFIRQSELTSIAARLLDIDEAGMNQLVFGYHTPRQEEHKSEPPAVPIAEDHFDRHYKTEGALLKFLFDNFDRTLNSEPPIKVGEATIIELEGYPFESIICKALWEHYCNSYYTEPDPQKLFFNTELQAGYNKVMGDFHTEIDFLQGINEMMRNEIIGMTSVDRSAEGFINYFKLKKINYMITINREQMLHMQGDEEIKCMLLHRELKKEQKKITDKMGITILK